MPPSAPGYTPPPSYAQPPTGYGPPPATPPGYPTAPPGYGQYPQYGPMPGEKSVVVSLILSFILTGLGQLYNGEISKGVIFLIVGIILAILTVLTFFLCIVWIPFWIYGMYDAYTRAEVYNRALRATGRPPW